MNAKHVALVSFALVALGGAFVAFEVLAPPPPPGELLEGRMTPVQVKALDLIIDLTHLFMTWSIAVIGAVGYFLKMSDSDRKRLSRPQLIAAELIILLCVASIFFGHLAITSLTESLALDVLSLIDGPHALYETIQYLLFLLALVAFGAFVHLTHWAATSKEDS